MILGKRVFWLCSLAVSLFLLSACSGLILPPSDEERPTAEAQGAHFIALGKPLDAALLFEKAATREKRPGYRIKAAEAYIIAKKYAKAKRLLKTTADAKLSHTAQVDKQLLWGSIALAENNQKIARSLLPALLFKDIPHQKIKKPQWEAAHLLRAQLFELLKDYSAAARERNLLSLLLSVNSIDYPKNQKRLWQALGLSSQEALRGLKKYPDQGLAGWIDLSLLNKALIYDYPKLLKGLEAWRTHYPKHPAEAHIVQKLLEDSRQLTGQFRSVALLLPMSGALKSAAEAIRDGFLITWYHDHAENKPKITLYDTNTDNIVNIYKKALADGADFVVGPLEKKTIDTLVKSGQIKTKILFLNKIDALPGDPMHKKHIATQFSLAPEDEVEAIVQHARQNGAIRAMVLSPANNLGKRLADAFRVRWEKSGGIIQRQRFYSLKVGLTANAVRSLLLHANAPPSSNSSKEELKKTSSPTENTDIIFLPGFANHVSLIVPRLKFYAGTKLPALYTTSQVRQVDASISTAISWRDIDSVMFPDMPWVLDASRTKSPFYQDLVRHLAINRSPYIKLYAFGIDSYHLIFRLSDMKKQLLKEPYLGKTGALYLAEDGHIKRKLVWGKVEWGKTKALP